MHKLSISALLALVTLAACASSGKPAATTSRLEDLRRRCEARGGMLVPSGRVTGQEALDYPCLIRGATSLPPSN